MPISRREISDLLQQTNLNIAVESGMLAKTVTATAELGDYLFEFSKLTDGKNHIEYNATVQRGMAMLLQASYSKTPRMQTGQLIARDLYKDHVSPLLAEQQKLMQEEAKKALVRPY